MQRLMLVAILVLAGCTPSIVKENIGHIKAEFGTIKAEDAANEHAQVGEALAVSLEEWAGPADFPVQHNHPAALAVAKATSEEAKNPSWLGFADGLVGHLPWGGALITALGFLHRSRKHVRALVTGVEAIRNKKPGWKEDIYSAIKRASQDEGVRDSLASTVAAIKTKIRKED